MDNNIEYDFIIRIDFDKGSKDPSRIFSTMTNLIETFQSIDADLAKTIDSQISPTLLLEDVKSGSLKTYFKNILISNDDNSIKDYNWKNIVGSYLYRAKYKILEFLNDNNSINDRAQIESLQNELYNLAEDTNVRGLPGYAPLPLDRLLNGVKQISSATKNLKKEDNAEYITNEGTVQFNKAFNYDSDKIEELLTRETLSNKSELILKVKKPDYLGDSMWDFKNGDHPLQAKIIDNKWLSQFRSRLFDIRPGDAIRAIVEFQVSYGYKGEIITTHNFILEVKEIIPGNIEEINKGLFQ